MWQTVQIFKANLCTLLLLFNTASPTFIPTAYFLFLVFSFCKKGENIEKKKVKGKKRY